MNKILIVLCVLCFSGCSFLFSDAAFYKAKEYKYKICTVSMSCHYSNDYIVVNGVVSFVSDNGHKYKSSVWVIKDNKVK